MRLAGFVEAVRRGSEADLKVLPVAVVAVVVVVVVVALAVVAAVVPAAVAEQPPVEHFAPQGLLGCLELQPPELEQPAASPQTQDLGRVLELELELELATVRQPWSVGSLPEQGKRPGQVEVGQVFAAEAQPSQS